jgi:hypothetical protein
MDPDHLHFGALYYGQAKTMKCRLVNTGSEPLAYNCSATQGRFLCMFDKFWRFFLSNIFRYFFVS